MAAVPILSTCVDLRDIDDRKDRPERSPLDDVQRDGCVFIKEMGEGRCSSQYKKRDSMLSPPTSKTVRALIPSLWTVFCVLPSFMQTYHKRIQSAAFPYVPRR